MRRILVDSPTGEQKIIDLLDGGCYFDESLVIWDESLNGPLPDIVIGGMIVSDEGLIYDLNRMSVHNAAVALPQPQQVSMRQARLALLDAGLLDDVESVISAAGRAAQIEWEYAATVGRSHPVIAIVQQQQSLTDVQINALFASAAAL